MHSSNGGPLTPSAKTYNLLYGKSSNRCAFTGCKNPITLNRTIVGNVCHIKAAKPGGPRYDPNQTNDERHGYDNLLLMCSVHNKVVDDDEATYTVDRLKRMKAEHEAQSAPIPAENMTFVVELLVSGNDTVAAEARDVKVTATNVQNSVVAGIYQNIVHNYGLSPAPGPSGILSKPSFVFAFGVPLGDNNSATWIMMLKHYGPAPAFNCTVDFYDKDRTNIQHEWLQKHPDSPFAPPGLVGQFRKQIHVSEAGPEGSLPMFNWTPLDPDRQHYSASISTRDGIFVESWEVTRVNGRLRAKVTIERGPQWIKRNPTCDPMVFKFEDPEFVSVPLLTEAPKPSTAKVHPGWKPNYKFEVPVAIIDSNGNLQVVSAVKAPDGGMLDDFGCWDILTKHFGDD
jgi:hypothetical protein